MKKAIIAKIFGRSLRGMLYRTVCVLLVLTALTAWSVSGVYAKYVSAAALDGYAGVANMGVKKFELVEHYAEDISDNLSEVATEGTLYKLDYDKDTVLNNTYSKVIPGVDIPKDPHINLTLENNNVSYELYLKVDESDFYKGTYIGSDEKEHRIISYELTDVWEEVKDSNGNVIEGLYKYKTVFMAGTAEGYTFEYGSTENPAIRILKNNKLKVSEHFNSEIKTEFSLTFTAYLQQVIDIPQSNSGTESGD